MSADTMPCGCLGHADYETLCRYPVLEKRVHELEAVLRRIDAEMKAGHELMARAILADVLRGGSEIMTMWNRPEKSSALALADELQRCDHDVQPLPDDANWGRCTKCGDGGFPLTDAAAYGETTCNVCHDTGLTPVAVEGALADGPCPNGCGGERIGDILERGGFLSVGAQP